MDGITVPGVRVAVQDKALKLTSAFEGHEEGYAAGNFDGQILTWGDLGFALKDGHLYPLFTRIVALNAGLFKDHPEVLNALRGGKPAFSEYILMHWEDPSGRVLVAAQEFLKSIFNDPAVRQAITESSKAYFDEAEKICVEYTWQSERAYAFAFDIAVQNGSISHQAQAEYLYDLRPGWDELNKLRTMAYAVGESAPPMWKHDVLARKLTVALGVGTVHGRYYDLAKQYDLLLERPWAD